MTANGRTRTERILDLAINTSFNCHQDEYINHKQNFQSNQIEQPIFEVENDIFHVYTSKDNKENNDIPIEGDILIPEVNLQNDFERNLGKATDKNEETELRTKVVSITPGSDEISSSTSSSDSSSSDSDSSSKSDSSEKSIPEPFGSDDSLKDPTYDSPLSDNRNDYSSDDEENVSPSNEKRKVKDPCKTVKVAKKRKRNIEDWKKNVTKRLRNSGESYVSTSIRKNQDGTKTISKVTRPARTLLPPCNIKCKLKCSEKISLDERRRIFNEYWNLKELDKQREFIASNMETVNPKYKYSNRELPRNPNNAYYFLIQQKQVRVCKYFFMATLAINHRVISTTLKKQFLCQSSKVVEKDKRGRHGKHKKIDENIKNGVKNHINSIPRVESHYCRSHSKKEYIEGDKTIADLHRDYIESCIEQNSTFANYFIYTKIFNEEFNIAFHSPKKDQCELCLQYKNSSDQQKQEIEQKYNEHVREKDLSRKLKEAYKNSDDRTKVIVFDLQAVLPCPIGDAKSFYYVSKLNVFNFTLYDLKSHEGTCFLWHEGEAHRGANEIGSCILKYLQEMDQQTNKDLNVVFYSDNCAGQNKNKFVIAMYMYAVFCLGIKSITHNFFITGHGQSEGDSMHAMIKKQVVTFKKSSPIYTPDQYACIIRAAKKNGKPYKVNELCHNDFIDLKALAIDLSINLPKEVKLTEIKAFKIDENHPNVLLYKISFEQDDYDVATIVSSRKKYGLGKGKVVLKRAYTKKTGIADKKKNGLLSLFVGKKTFRLL